MISALAKSGYIEAVAYHQNPAFEAAVLFAKAEGVVPAPETAHAIKATIDEALRCKASGEKKVILCNFSGHGHFDLAAYDAYLTGKLVDTEYSSDELVASLGQLPKVQ